MSPPFPLEFPIRCPSIVDRAVTYTIEQNHRFACIPSGQASENELRSSLERCRDEDGPTCIFRDICKVNEVMMVGLFRMDREVLFVEDEADEASEVESASRDEASAPQLDVGLVVGVAFLLFGAEVFYRE